MTEHGFNDVELVDELVSLICPIDTEGPSKLGKYYTCDNGQRHDFDSSAEADFHAKMTGSIIWAYDK